MRAYFIELSNYAITIFMALYTYECFAVFRYETEKNRNKRKSEGIYTRQIILIMLVQLCCFMNLLLVSGELEYLFLYAFVQIFLLFALVMSRIIYERMNRLLLNNMCMLTGVGFIMISRLSFDKAIRQYVIALISLAAAMAVPYLLHKFSFWKRYTWAYAAAGIAFLSVVLILGEVTRGSRISFSIAGLTFQPSEFVKVIFIFFLAGALWEDTSIKRVVFTTIISGIHVIVLVVSRDLGSALIFFIGFLFVLFIATKNYWYLLIGAVFGCIAAYGAYLMFSHVQIRVLAWQDPWSHIDRQGYQITQSLFAIGGGSWFGVGLLKGNPTAIPFVEADFIFSSICEELGAVFGICLILICISCFIMIMNISVWLKDRFYQLVACGLGIIYVFQIFLTVGGGIKFIPLTGVTLPFVSHGGSSIMTTMILFFIVQGVYIIMLQEGEKHLVRKRKVRQKENTGKSTK